MAISFMGREEKLCRAVVISAKERGELFVTRGTSRDGFKDLCGFERGNVWRWSEIQLNRVSTSCDLTEGIN